MRSPSRLASWLLPLSLLLAAEARAQTPDPGALIAAQTLYDEASKALERKDYASACPKLEEVVRLVPEGIGAKLSLAECYEGSGRTASAWGMYLVVAELAGRIKQQDRRVLAEKRAAALKPKLAQLVIVVPPALRALAGLEVRRDDVVIGQAQWGLPVPVDRGQRAIVVTAAGKKPWKKIVPLETEGAVVTVELEPLEADKPAEPAPVAPVVAPVVAPRPIPPPPPRPFWGGQRIAGTAIAGVGLVGIGVGAVFGAQAISKKGDAGCNDNVCPSPTSVGLFNDAKLAANVSTGLFIAGGALFAGGAVIFLTRVEIAEGAEHRHIDLVSRHRSAGDVVRVG